MSADNWAVCPRCSKRLFAAVYAYEEKVAAAYGSVTVDVFDSMRDKLAEMRQAAEKPKQNLREDYEVGIFDGDFFLSYKGRCYDDACDFTFEYKHEEVVA